MESIRHETLRRELMNPKRSKVFVATIFSAGLLLSAIATPTTAGIVPWAWNLLFGPPCSGSTCGGCQLTSCGRCYQASPTYRAPVYSTPSYSSPVYSQPAAPVYSVPIYSVPSYSTPSYSVPSYSVPSYSVPSSSCPSCTTPAYSEPVYAPTSGIFYNGGMYDGGVVYGDTIQGESIVSGEIVGGQISSGYAPYGETIVSGPISGGSYIEPSCSSCTSGCGIVYPDNGTIVGPVIDNTVPSVPVSSFDNPQESPMDNSLQTDTLDAVGPKGIEPDDEPFMQGDDEGDDTEWTYVAASALP